MWEAFAVQKLLLFFQQKISVHLVNKRAKRPWIADLSIQAKSQTFKFEIWVTFDQGQRMTLTFHTHSFINSFSWMLPAPLRPKAATVSKKKIN